MSTLQMPRDPVADPRATEAAATILAGAAERGRAAQLSYAGAVTPCEAYRLHVEGAAVIVDVRTQPEWEYVGHFPGAVPIEWRAWGASAPDPDFVARIAERFDRDTPLLFLCRSAVRSHHAAEAVTRGGFTHAYNILEGFEGALDAEGHRGHAGWRAAGLPWRQG